MEHPSSDTSRNEACFGGPWSGLFLLISSLLTACTGGEGSLPVDTQPFYEEIEAVNYHLRNFATDHEGEVYGSMGPELHRIVDDGDRSELIHRFTQKINGIHVTRNGAIIVATDAHTCIFKHRISY